MKQTFFIAEIGKGFIQTKEDKTVSEYLQNAKELVLKAKESGADAAKFQIHHLEDEQLNVHVVSPHFKESDRYAWVKRNEESTPFESFWKPIIQYCKELNITFMVTPMSRGAAQILDPVDIPIWKIGSGDMLDFVLIDYLSKKNKPIIISSGMSTFDEVKKAVTFVEKRTKEVTLLHCVSKYPCPLEELNLQTITYYKDQFPDIEIGFSDHSLGFEGVLIAVALGATVIEKHFSTSREHWGSDHKVSLLPEEFSEMVKEVRAIENEEEKKKEILEKANDILLGKNQKIMNKEEEKFRFYFRKNLVASRDLTAGTTISPEHIYAMRPKAEFNAYPSQDYEQIIGKKTKKDLKKYDFLNEENIE
ncbi:MAG: N-acetylneuraminate synthase family protein [Nanoarchaeota archaeon]|nr:N-acetylneuraminate synthase family protein [Nanoarchaeota archaeon]